MLKSMIIVSLIFQADFLFLCDGKISYTYWGPGKAVEETNEILPFEIDVPNQVIDDLNQRLKATRPLAPPLEGAKWTYGIPPDSINMIKEYWINEYKWYERQILLNTYPQFTTKIQGLQIHFYHIKPSVPKDENVKALPILLVHGWPGSVVEFQKIIPFLTKPRTHRNFVFEVVIPSLPGFGFSQPAARPGLGAAQVAAIFQKLMHRLGYNQFYTQGGDWGSIVTSDLAALYPESVRGTHLNLCISLSPKTLFWTLLGSIFPSMVVNRQNYSRMYPLSQQLIKTIKQTGFLHHQATEPDTLGVAMSDSPIGLAAYILAKFSAGTNPEYANRVDGGLTEKFTMDELLDNVMIYYVTNSIVTSQRFYAENLNVTYLANGFERLPLKVPVACSMFPHETFYQPESIIKDRYPKLIQVTYKPRGGHFAALEEPELLADDIWKFVQKVEAEN